MNERDKYRAEMEAASDETEYEQERRKISRLMQDIDEEIRSALSYLMY